MTTICPLCNASATCVYQGMKGYIEGSSFSIYECSSCGASFVDPLRSDENVYNSIYTYGEKISGYMRYYRFAQVVKKVTKPLSLLAESENVYWGVQQALLPYRTKKDSLKILEIGSGLGYLTYSLNKEGYSTLGLDISKRAVEQATKNYGSYYECGNLFDIAEKRKGLYDIVIMTELLEHVEDPKAFIKAASMLIRDGGKIILTTPNKDSSPKGLVWQNDIPPVHLWWFSEKSVEHLAKECGKKCSFVDYTPYTKKYFEYSVAVPLEVIEANLPRLTKEGTIFPGKEVINTKARFFSVLMYTRISNVIRRLKSKTVSSRSSSMCAVIS